MCIVEKQETLKKYWSDFIKHGTIHPQVRPFIAESWKRCWNYGPGKELDEKVTEAGAQKIIEDNRLLYDIAWPFLLKMKELVAGSQHAITLHDKGCRLLARVFAGNIELFSGPGFRVGVQWSEERMGTTGPNVSILLDRELQIIGAEHYNFRLSEVTCSSAPIHDKSGTVIGCINMTSRCSDSNPYTLGLVSAMAFAIEKSLELMLDLKIMDDTFSVVSEGIIVLDADFCVTRASRNMCAMLKVSMEELNAMDLRTLLSPEDFELRLKAESEPFTYPEYKMRVGSRSISCSVTVLPLRLRGKYTGTVLFFREGKTVTRLTNQLAGNQSRYSFEDIITKDKEMRTLIQTMEDIARTGCSVLIEGESGTGKELFAHSIHSASSRAQGPFVVVNCASLPRSLVESELFGYEKGAFTGASATGNPGKFELADGGTIFLDEIGELPLEIQAKLLRVLDNHRVMRIGGREERPLDVRVIAATNRNLYQEVQDQNFRADLYFRINVIKFDIPPLRKRGNDILELAEVFLHKMNVKEGGIQKRFSQPFTEAILSYSWPGNVRELHNIIVRAFYCSRDVEIVTNDLPPDVRQQVFSSKAPAAHAGKSSSEGRSLQEFEKQQIMDALHRFGGDVVQAGLSMGLSKSTIYRRIKKYQINLGDY